MTCPPHHVEYASEALARNAVTLHVLRYPHCVGYEVFPCEDHWHVGHDNAGHSQACKQHPEHRATSKRMASHGRR